MDLQDTENGGKNEKLEDLAKTATKGITKKRLKVPVTVILISMIFLAIGAITIPLGMIISNCAQGVVKDLTGQIIQVI
ncbi:hypothetical protein HK096_002331 [Nowakowskiella sp. JEL0078]|nr:hypothetical protein HK096_002331 [Nowakowskiella sp. JEL0078]